MTGLAPVTVVPVTDKLVTIITFLDRHKLNLAFYPNSIAMDSMQDGKAVLPKWSYTTLGIEPRPTAVTIIVSVGLVLF